MIATSDSPAPGRPSSPGDRKLRVLHVQDKCGHGGSQIQGVQQLLMWWWPALRDAGVEPDICILRSRNAASRHFDEIGVPVHYLGRGRFDPRTLTDLVGYVKRRGFDVLHCHGYGSTTFGRVAGRLCRVPVIVHEHMIDPAIPVYQEAVDRLIGGLTTRAIAVSDAVADFMVERRHIRRDRIDIVHNSVPDEFFCRVSVEERARAAERLGLDPALIYVGMVGRLHPVKGHDVFLEGVARIADRHPRARFLVVGQGDLLDELVAMASRLGISAQVSFLGYQEDLIAFLQVFDVLAMPSRSEGSPLTLFQAMAAGKAIVATRVGGIPEIVTDGAEALLVPSEDPAGLGDAIDRLLSDPALRERLASRAEELARDRYRIASTARRLREIYERAMARGA